MSKFTKVLSPSDIRKLTILLVQDKPRHSATLIRYIEQTVLAKLAEQEPVTTVSQESFSSNDTSDIITNNLPVGVKLYAHPCVSPMSDKPSCDSQNGKCDSQIPDGTLTDEGTKEHHRTTKNHIPDGYQLVPIEPTDEMHHAARDWSVEKYGKAIGFEASHGCYKAMLAAAPKYEEE